MFLVLMMKIKEENVGNIVLGDYIGVDKEDLFNDFDHVLNEKPIIIPITKTRWSRMLTMLERFIRHSIRKSLIDLKSEFLFF